MSSGTSALQDCLLAFLTLKTPFGEHMSSLCPLLILSPTIFPEDWVYLKVSSPQALNPCWSSQRLVILTTMAVKPQEVAMWIYLSQLKRAPGSFANKHFCQSIGPLKPSIRLPSIRGTPNHGFLPPAAAGNPPFSHQARQQALKINATKA